MSSKPKHSGRTLFALGFGFLIDQGESEAMGVLVPIIQSMYGVSFVMVGLMTTLRNITQTVSAPLWGYAADRFSRKKVLVFGTGIWGLWTIAVGLMPNFTAMLVVRAISGLGLGALMPATFSLLGDHYPQNRAWTRPGRDRLRRHDGYGGRGAGAGLRRHRGVVAMGLRRTGRCQRPLRPDHLAVCRGASARLS